MIEIYNYPCLGYDGTPSYSLGSTLHRLLFADLLKQAGRREWYNHNRRARKDTGKPVLDKQIETDNLYQIQIFKRHGNFNGYQIRAIRTQLGQRLFKIMGLEDIFEKLYELSDKVDIKNIDWKWFKHENALVVNLPKNSLSRSDQIEERKHLSNARRSRSRSKNKVHGRHLKHGKRIKKKLGYLNAAKPEFHGNEKNSSNQYITQAHYDKPCDSASEITSSNEPTKASDFKDNRTESSLDSIKKGKYIPPSIEEVEDEEFASFRRTTL